MSDFVRWLVGLKESPEWISGGRWHLEFQALPSGGTAMAGVALLLLAIAGIWWLYRLEKRNISRFARLLFVFLRFGVLASVLVMLLEMVLVITKVELVPSQMLVLLDTSESMSLQDPYTDQAVALQTAQAVGLVDKEKRPQADELRKKRRVELAERATGDLLKPLSDGRLLSVYTFSNKLEPLPKGQNLKGLKARGVDTAVGEALNAALAAHRGQPIAGVLLVSDGQSNAGPDARKSAQQFGKEGILIHTLAVGTEQGPSDARLVEIESSPVVFVRDPTEVSVLVEARGLQGRPAVVTLEQRPADGDWVDIGREEVVLGEDAAVRRVTFHLTPENTGQFDLRARVSDVGPELTESNNVATRALKVVRQRIRVLVIAGSPSPDVQFIRNALLRDVGLEFASWLQTATEGYEQVGHRPIRRLPVTQQELEQYDVLILFDPDMRALDPRAPEMFTKFVGDAGGGLVYVAGELHTQSLFSGGSAGGEADGGGPIDNSWLKILPVATDQGLYQSAADVRLSSRDTWTLELSADGVNDAIFRFDADPNKNKEILTSLPGMYWHFPVSRPKPAATVLARHGDPRMSNAYGRHVLLATQRYGPGRTVFIGFDSTYRWRYLHEQYFDGFWARLIDRVGRSKVLGGRYPFTLTTDKSVYRAGERVTLRATMTGASDEASPIAELRGDVELSGQPPMPIQLEPLADQPGVLETTFTAQEAGAYLVRIVPAASSAEVDDSSMRRATLGFKVEPPRQELDNPKLDRALLEDVAKASAGGKLFSLADYRKIPDAFSVKKVERVLEYRDEMWDAPILFGAFLLLLTAEWVLRKKCRMA